MPGGVIDTAVDGVIIIDDRYARKAIEKGADGLIAVAAGAGGQHADPGRAAEVGATEAGHRREHQHAFEARAPMV